MFAEGNQSRPLEASQQPGHPPKAHCNTRTEGGCSDHTAALPPNHQTLEYLPSDIAIFRIGRAPLDWLRIRDAASSYGSATRPHKNDSGR